MVKMSGVAVLLFDQKTPIKRVVFAMKYFVTVNILIKELYVPFIILYGSLNTYIKVKNMASMFH